MGGLLNILGPLWNIINGRKTYAIALALAGAGAWMLYSDQTQMGLWLLGLSGLGASLRHALQKILDQLPKE